MPRLVHGKSDAQQVLKWIYRDLRSLDEYRNSIRLTTLAAAAKFDVDPAELLREEAEAAPSGEKWKTTVKPRIIATVLGVPEGPSSNGHN